MLARREAQGSRRIRAPPGTGAVLGRPHAGDGPSRARHTLLAGSMSARIGPGHGPQLVLDLLPCLLEATAGRAEEGEPGCSLLVVGEAAERQRGFSHFVGVGFVTQRLFVPRHHRLLTYRAVNTSDTNTATICARQLHSTRRRRFAL